MKRYIGILTSLVLCFTFSACGKNENGTYYPNSGVMKANLENAGYSVMVSENFDEKYTGTYQAIGESGINIVDVKVKN